VDHIRQCKEGLKVHKPSKSSTAPLIFTDDGFPMGKTNKTHSFVSFTKTSQQFFSTGIAYLLQVLGQDEDFDSLDWFREVSTHFKEQENKEAQLLRESKNDEKLTQTSKLTTKRFHETGQEFQLLDWALGSARLFFQSNAMKEKVEK
jgi:hypothetical protein